VSKYIAYNEQGFVSGVEIAFRPPITAAQFIDKSSLFVLLPNVVRHAKATADTCN
jgi:hypothetical protein